MVVGEEENAARVESSIVRRRGTGRGRHAVSAFGFARMEGTRSGTGGVGLVARFAENEKDSKRSEGDDQNPSNRRLHGSDRN